MSHIVTSDAWMETRTWIDREDADIDAYVRQLGQVPGYDLKSKLYDWRDRGVVVFENAVDHAMIDALVDDVDYLRSHHREFDLAAEFKGEQKQIAEFSDAELESDGVKFNSIHTLSRAAALLSLTPVAMNFLSHVFKSSPCALQSLTFYKGSQQRAHIDYPYVRCQTRLADLAASWIPLEDIRADSGPLAYYPGTHRPEFTGFFDWGDGSIVLEPGSKRAPNDFSDYLYERIRESSIEPEIFLPKKGDILIWHGNLIHEGTRVEAPAVTRKSYVTHYTSLNGYPREHMRSDRAGLFENGGFVFEYPWLSPNRARLPSWGRR